ncbi:Riboflavin transporter RibZ [bioreactor metagenome]|uniref:Riboflavin transporter RibZ n=1 Tax=bioreactor metagenome TaxID=1076179 RepID=A0A644X2G6_9ZZZZ
MRNQRLLLIAIIISSVLSPFLSAAMNVALPMLSSDLGMNASELSWVNMSFLLASAAFCIPLGKIADRIGRRQIFLLGNIVVLLTSGACLLAQETYFFLSLRFLQGIGSSMMFVTATAIITSAFPKESRGKFLGYNVTSVYIGLSAAPVLGGFLIQYFNWHSLFYITIINSIAVIFMLLFYKGEDWKEQNKEPFDYIGSVLYIVFMSLLMYGFANITHGFAQIMTATGAIGIIGFIVYEYKLKQPVFDVRFFASSRRFAFSNLAALINYAATFAVGFLLSLYFQYSRGLSPGATGAILMIQPVIMAVTAIISGRLSDKYDSRILASSGMLLSAIGIGMLFFINDETSLGFILAALSVLGLGFGFFSTPNTHSVMNSVEPRQFGMASATISTMRISGQMISMGMAALFISWIIGAQKVTTSNALLLVDVMQYVFGIFFFLLLLGTWFSWARGKHDA